MLRVAAILFVKFIFGQVAWTILVWRGLAVFSILHWIAITLVTFLIYRPVVAAWDASANGKCGDQVASYVALGVVGAVIDLIILAFPIILLCHW